MCKAKEGRRRSIANASPFSAILLGAGAGRRFGGGKLVAPFRGRPLVAWALEAADAAPIDEILLVVGAGAEAVVAAVRGVETSRPVRIVRAPRWADGMSASLKAAGAALRPDRAGAFIFLGDMPDIPPAVLPPLAAAVEGGAAAAAPSWRGRRGHPVLLGTALLRRLPELSGDEGARTLLDSPDVRVATIPTDDPGILLDVDRPAPRPITDGL